MQVEIPSQSEYIKSIFPFLEQFMKNEFSMTNFPGCALGILLKNELVWSQAYGSADLKQNKSINSQKSLFRCASITKSFTVIMLYQLYEQNKLNLDDLLIKYVPECSVIKPFNNNSILNITLRSLASHCSGLPSEGNFDRYNGAEMPTIDFVLKNIDIECLEDPYKKFKYSNLGFILLGLALERVAKVPYKKYIEENILKKLDMNNSTLDFQQQKNIEFETIGYMPSSPENPIQAPTVSYGEVVPCGGLLTNIEDLSKYLQFIMYGNKEDVLKNSTLNMIKSPVTLYQSKSKTQQQPQILQDFAYGNGWSFGVYDNQYQVISHTGQTWGFCSKILIIPELEFGFLFWNNSWNSYLRIVNECLSIVVPALIKYQKFSVTFDEKFNKQGIPDKKKYTKQVYLQAVADQNVKPSQLRITIPPKDDSLKILALDVLDNDGFSQNNIKLKAVEGSKTKFKALNSYCENEIMIFIHQKLEEENNNSNDRNVPDKIKFLGKIYNKKDSQPFNKFL